MAEVDYSVKLNILEGCITLSWGGSIVDNTSLPSSCVDSSRVVISPECLIIEVLCRNYLIASWPSFDKSVADLTCSFTLTMPFSFCRSRRFLVTSLALAVGAGFEDFGRSGSG